MEVAWDEGMLMNSTLPVNSDEFVPPKVKIPPGSSSATSVWPLKRVIQNAISGDESWFWLTRASQNGVDCVEEMPENARPIIPETGPTSSEDDTCSTDTTS